MKQLWANLWLVFYARKKFISPSENKSVSNGFACIYICVCARGSSLSERLMNLSPIFASSNSLSRSHVRAAAAVAAAAAHLDATARNLRR